MAVQKPLLTKKRLAQLDQTLREAWQAQQQNRLDAAEAGYRAVLALKPTHFDALHLLSVVCYGRGQYAEALTLIGAALKTKPEFPDALSNHGMILHALNRYSEALESYDRALKFKPDYAEVHANRGNALLRLGRRDESLACYDRAIALKPGYFAALYNRGNALLALDRPSDALASYDAALALVPNHPDTINNRGNALLKLGRTADALAAYDMALTLDPGRAEAASNKGNALNALGRPQEALAAFDKALSNEPEFASSHYNASMARLMLGDFKAGWAQYEWRWQVSQFHGQQRNFTAPLWLGQEPLAGKTILLHGEQGFGDTIQFVRYAPMVAALGATVLLEVPPPLAPLMQGMPGVTRVIAGGEALPAFDFQCPLMSLPHAFGTELSSVPANVPYLTAPADRMAKFAAALTPMQAPRIGLAWSGRPTHLNDRNRSLSLTQLVPLFSAQASFVSLQRDVRPEDATVLAQLPLLHFGEQLCDFADTAAVISQLDLVISVDTSVAHLAGALGKPVWILLPHAVDFRWMLSRPDSPWYPTAKLLRQQTAGDWAAVVAQAAAMLPELLPPK
jgi:tetratricopeptide (TPR) repeat protein